jgi:acyl-coenzyme A synthetase/AMP-(fatty) acid ligase
VPEVTALVLVVPELPRDTVGKILKRELREQVAQVQNERSTEGEGR